MQSLTEFCSSFLFVTYRGAEEWYNGNKGTKVWSVLIKKLCLSYWDRDTSQPYTDALSQCTPRMNFQWNGSVVISNGIKRSFNKHKVVFKGYMPAVFPNIQTRNSVPSTEESGGISSREDNVNGR